MVAAKSAETKPNRPLNRRNVSARAERIACTACGAPLEVRNADMAEMTTCRACGSILDLESDDYAVLGKVLEAKRPKVGLPLGAKGSIKGGNYEVIGRQRLSDSGDSWNEYLLFHPKRGYLWLQEESGHWVVLKKLKNKPKSNPQHIGVNSSFSHMGDNYKVLSKGVATISFIEGEFPYQSKVGDKQNYLDAVAPPLMTSAEWTEKEIEWYGGSYLPASSICTAFKMKPSDLPRSQGVGACQPFLISPLRKTMGRTFALTALLCLLIALVSLGFGSKVATFQVPPDQYLVKENESGYLSEPFKISKSTIVQVNTEAPVNNSWIYAEIQLVGENEATLLSYTNELNYYHGVEGGESWSEGSQSDSSVFRVNEPGTYRLAIGGQGGQGNTGTTPRRETIRVDVYEGVMLQRYFLISALLLWVLPVYDLIRRGRFEAERQDD